MPDEWAISSRDLHVEVGTSRVRESLERALRESVQTGRLITGTLLPSSRALASDLGIARNTVAEAYTQLVAEGWLTARQGSGTRVATQAATAPSDSAQPESSVKPAPYDLRAGYPDLTSFPRSEWLAAARTAISAAPAEAFGYGDPRGRLELRTALAGYLARARGVRVTPESVVVCSGFTQALWLLGTALQKQGARAIGVEAYGHQRHRDLLTHVGLRIAALPVDEHGAEPADLFRLDAALLTPAHQFPLGVELEGVRRSRFAQWAAKSGGVVIEDDYDGEFRYDRRPVGAMQALAPDHVAYVGTASKTLAPGMRLAWMVLPDDLLPGVVALHSLIASHSAVLDQLTLAEFISSGRYDRHIRRCRLAYRRRRDRLVATLAGDQRGLRLHGLPAGLHAVLDLPPGTSEEEIQSRAAARGLALDALSGYATEPASRPPALVIGYATPPAHSYTGALARLGAILAEG
jgi:GntR family transcriptional regulator/MocR family aminotransferase